MLLILAGISINMLAGDNGLLTKASNTKIASEQGNILEQLRLEIYEKSLNIEDQTTEIDWLKTKGIIQQEIKEEQSIAKLATTNEKIKIAKTYVDINKNETKYILNINKIIKEPITGHGTWKEGDIYYLLQGDLYYKSKDGEAHLLGKIYTETNSQNIKWIYEENSQGNVEITGMDLSDFSREIEGSVYDSSINLKREKLEIPAQIEGKKVVKINITTILPKGPNDAWWNGYKEMNVKEIVLGEGVEEVNSLGMSYGNIERIQLPNSVKKINEGIYFYRSDELIINFENGKHPELQLPEGKWGANKIVIQGIEQ